MADESCDFTVVRALRGVGHEVTAIVEIAPRLPDDEVLALAAARNHVLLTEDKDFGELVYVRRQRSGGVILIRFPGNARTALAGVIAEAVKTLGAKLHRRFTVIEPGKIRSRGETEG